MPKRLRLTTFALALMFTLGLAGAAVAAEQTTPNTDLQKLNQQASNPVGQLWMLSNQFNLNLLKSDTVHAFKDPQNQFVWNFQPVMPIALSSDVRMVVRPVIPIVNTPYVQDMRDVRYTFGIGDVGLQAIFTPNTDSATGFIWGVGPTVIAPTAPNKYLGKGKWEAGPAAAALYITDTWVVGAYGQHWWSFAGDSTRSDVSYTNIQYFLWYSPAPTWQIGMGPNVTIDWQQTKAEDRLTLPVGLGVAKMFMLGKLPIKLSFEADYSVVRPRNVPGNEWTFRINFTPIIKSLL